jgi:UDPglucose--hexose-1-phosphate uridylyltransferase
MPVNHFEGMPSQLRKDPIIGRWVIIATDRAKKPDHFGTPREQGKPSFCPFCPGKEDRTPPEVLVFRPKDTQPNTPGWWLRVVPNRFPVLRVEGNLDRRGEGLYDLMNGIGAHDVVIETPKHHIGMADLEPGEIEEVLWAYRFRVCDLKKDIRFRYLLIFKNHGTEAGSSVEHSHSQIIGIPIVPKRVSEEIAGARQYFDYRSERCVFCDIIHHETERGERVVAESSDFIALAPFASRFPFETWVLPKRHQSHFESIEKGDIQGLAKMMKRVLWKIKDVLDDPPYNFVVHNSPSNVESLPHYHWHIEIIPKMSHTAGFEWGTGFYINPVLPEEAAKFLAEREPAPAPVSVPKRAEPDVKPPLRKA